MSKKFPGVTPRTPTPRGAASNAAWRGASNAGGGRKRNGWGEKDLEGQEGTGWGRGRRGRGEEKGKEGGSPQYSRQMDATGDDRDETLVYPRKDRDKTTETLPILRPLPGVIRHFIVVFKGEGEERWRKTSTMV